MDGALMDILRQRPQLIFAVGVAALFMVVLASVGLYVLFKALANRARPVEGNNVFKAELNCWAQRRA